MGPQWVALHKNVSAQVKLEGELRWGGGSLSPNVSLAHRKSLSHTATLSAHKHTYTHTDSA